MTTPKKIIGRILAPLTIFFAAIMALASLSPIDFSGLFMALGFFIPGAWWYYAQSKDKKARTEYEQRAKSHAKWQEHLDPVKDHALLAGMGNEVPAPKPFRRRWSWVAFATFVMFAISTVLTPTAPAASETETAEEVTTTSEPTSSASSTPSTTSTTEPTSSTTTSTATTTTTTSTTTREPEPTTQKPTEEPYVEQVYQAPEPAYTPRPDPTPAPQPIMPQPVAPVIQESPSVYYQNCTAVRAAGAAPLYIGSPGYAPKLDRDGDGVACE